VCMGTGISSVRVRRWRRGGRGRTKTLVRPLCLTGASTASLENIDATVLEHSTAIAIAWLLSLANDHVSAPFCGIAPSRAVLLCAL
jgi:hypothetical protein